MDPGSAGRQRLWLTFVFPSAQEHHAGLFVEPATGVDGCDGEVVEFDRQYPEKKQRCTAETHADRHLVDRTAPDRTRHTHRQHERQFVVDTAGVCDAGPHGAAPKVRRGTPSGVACRP